MKIPSGLVLWWLATATPIVAAEPPPKPAAEAAQRVQKIAEVTSVELALDAETHTLTITAKGSVPTGGWSNPTLARFVYIAAPNDGVWGFEFRAQTPEGMATQVISPVEARFVWNNVPASVKAVRIAATQNQIVKPLAEAGK